MLNVRGLTKAYGKIVVADDIAFDLKIGECLGVIGPNGAGKSSLFNMLSGTAMPDSGGISLAGQDVTRLPAHARARLGIARAFQIPQPFPSLSVLDNVRAAATFGAGMGKLQAREAAMAVLDRTGLARVAHKPAGSLPLLDRKRLELAKAIASAPKLLLLDEVAGGLTEREVHQMVDLVRELKSAYAVIWIEHIAQALKAVSDRVMVLHFGRKLLEGTPQGVLESTVVQEIYMGIPTDAHPAST